MLAHVKEISLTIHSFLQRLLRPSANTLTMCSNLTTTSFIFLSYSRAIGENPFWNNFSTTNRINTMAARTMAMITYPYAAAADRLA